LETSTAAWHEHCEPLADFITRMAIMANVDEHFAGALRRLDGDRELFCELATYFIEDAPGLLKTARSGMVNRNADAAGRAMHALRGLIATFDADRAVATTKLIEDSASRGDWQVVPNALDRLDTEIDALRKTLLQCGVIRMPREAQ
jgi:HPt (histidine-containing phosphotransfer) domain-containing protein